MLSASPLPGGPDSDRYGGATVNVYTTEQSERAALALATREVAAAGWAVDAIDEQGWLSRADLLESPEGLAYFEQALQDGVVLVFHTYCHELPEGGVAH